MRERSSCSALFRSESHTIVYSWLSSIIAVSLVWRRFAPFAQMPRESTLRCAYADCKKTTDKSSFGPPRQLSVDQLASYSAWLRSPHDGVVCNCHYTMLRRLLDKQLQTQSAARMEELLAAPEVVETQSSTSIESSPYLSSRIQIERSSSLPLAATAQLTTPLRRSVSTPLLRANHVGCDHQQRRRIAFSCVMSGMTWTTHNRQEANLNMHSMNKSTWYNLTQQVWQTIEAVKADRDTAYAERLLAANQPIVVIADGAWSHPGYEAGQHDWVLMNAADKKAIFSIPLYRSRVCKGKVVHQGNYDDGSSKGMEGYALDIAIKRLQATGLAALITGWVGDQDSSVLKQLRQCSAAQKWEVHLDPNHGKKNLQKTLMDLFKSKRFEGLAKRVPAFIMRIIKRSETEHRQNVDDMRKQFLLWMDCVVPHYTRACGSDCPHHQRDGDEASVDDSITKTYLNPATDGVEIAALQSLVGHMKHSARYFIHGYNTCNAERYHRERLKLTPKLFEFWKTWAPRCNLNQLLHNDGYAETHRLVLAKLDELPRWSIDVEPGNQYMEAMDHERAYHATRKRSPDYNRRQVQLSREWGNRRAAHDRTSESRGHDYQHTPPLLEEEEKKERRRRRTSQEVKEDEAKLEAERERLRRLFDAGDTTFTTLGVIDVNMRVQERKAKKAKHSSSAGKENSDHPPAKRDARSSCTTPVPASTTHAAMPLMQLPVSRAIVFR